MNKEEYYSRMEKIDGKIRTDRCSFDEIHNLTIQQNYLKTQYIKCLQHNWNELKKWLEDQRPKTSEGNLDDFIIRISLSSIFSKMQELEEVGNNDNK